ncbi:hypothetical protein SORBI_3009G085001 [Sorghum bicolor]|uniref:Uncharacterized protein n=1 Tax=Sorghum bicolor TaxID=4558 RepID=A0A1Z5R1K5_SORBI|nr:hypothetical protein SORBI_3009G085001 [Sorghum bicolor]
MQSAFVAAPSTRTKLPSGDADRLARMAAVAASSHDDGMTGGCAVAPLPCAPTSCEHGPVSQHGSTRAHDGTGLPGGDVARLARMGPVALILPSWQRNDGRGYSSPIYFLHVRVTTRI